MLKKCLLLSILSVHSTYGAGSSSGLPGQYDRSQELDGNGNSQNFTLATIKELLSSDSPEELLLRNTRAREEISVLRKTFMREELTKKLPFLKLKQFYDKAVEAILDLKRQGHTNPTHAATQDQLEAKAISLENLGKFTTEISLDHATIVYLLAEGLLSGTLSPRKMGEQVGHECLLSMFFQTAKIHLDAISTAYDILQSPDIHTNCATTLFP